MVTTTPPGNTASSATGRMASPASQCASTAWATRCHEQPTHGDGSAKPTSHAARADRTTALDGYTEVVGAIQLALEDGRRAGPGRAVERFAALAPDGTGQRGGRPPAGRLRADGGARSDERGEAQGRPGCGGRVGVQRLKLRHAAECLAELVEEASREELKPGDVPRTRDRAARTNGASPPLKAQRAAARKDPRGLRLDPPALGRLIQARDLRHMRLHTRGPTTCALHGSPGVFVLDDLFSERVSQPEPMPLRVQRSVPLSSTPSPFHRTPTLNR